MIEFSDYQWLIESEEARRLLASLAQDQAPLHRQLATLRRQVTVARANLLVEQAALRARAREKFGQLSHRMFFSDLALQQATDLCLARYKAARFRREACLIDYCCGIGGDTLALAERGAVLGWDCSPVSVLLANANLRSAALDEQARAELGSVEDHSPRAAERWHVDPDRRAGGVRSIQPDFHSPSTSTITAWLSTAPSGAVKLAPGTEPPLEWQQQAELEWISHRRECKQLVAWFGDLGRETGRRRATKLLTTDHTESDLQVVSFIGDPIESTVVANRIERYVMDVDPALRGSGLADSFAREMGCEKLAPGACYFTSERPLEHGLATSFEVQDVLPLRISSLARHLRNAGVGRLEIKAIGVDHRPEQVRQQLKLAGNHEATLLLTRVEKKEIAILGQRM